MVGWGRDGASVYASGGWRMGGEGEISLLHETVVALAFYLVCVASGFFSSVQRAP